MTDFCRISKTCIGSLAKSERCDHSFTPPRRTKILYWLIVWRQCIRLAQHTNYQRNQVFLKRLYIYVSLYLYMLYRLCSWYTIFSSSVTLPLTLPTGSRSKSEQMMRRNLKENNSFDFAHNCTHLRAKFGELELELVWRSARCLRLLKTVTVGTTFVLKELVMENKASREFMQACRMDPSIFGYIWFEKCGEALWNLIPHSTCIRECFYFQNNHKTMNRWNVTNVPEGDDNIWQWYDMQPAVWKRDLESGFAGVYKSSEQSVTHLTWLHRLLA